MDTTVDDPLYEPKYTLRQSVQWSYIVRAAVCLTYLHTSSEDLDRIRDTATAVSDYLCAQATEDLMQETNIATTGRRRAVPGGSWLDLWWSTKRNSKNPDAEELARRFFWTCAQWLANEPQLDVTILLSREELDMVTRGDHINVDEWGIRTEGEQ